MLLFVIHTSNYRTYGDYPLDTMRASEHAYAMSKKSADLQQENNLVRQSEDTNKLKPEAGFSPAATLVLEKSYYRRLIECAYQQTREHKKTELIATSIVALIFGAFAGGGFTTKGFVLAVVAFVAVISFIFLCHLILAPQKLDAAHRKELFTARLQLEEENAKNDKPEIKCEIKEVIEECASAHSNVGFDYIFTVCVYLRNERATTNVQGFSLQMIQGSHVYEAERVSLRDYYLERQEPRKSGAEITLRTVTENLLDLEDTKLDPIIRNIGKTGWLRFVVRKVNWGDEYENDTRIPKTIELTVVDANGTPYKAKCSQPWPTSKVEIRQRLW